MGRNNYYDLCRKYMGKCVRITDNRGCVHVGHISKVDNRMVWIRPVNRVGGYGFGYWGPRSGGGFGYGIALGTITGIALTGLLFW